MSSVSNEEQVFNESALENGDFVLKPNRYAFVSAKGLLQRCNDDGLNMSVHELIFNLSCQNIFLVMTI